MSHAQQQSRRVVSPFGPLVNTRAMLSMLERERVGGLTDASKKLVIDSLSAAAEPSDADRKRARTGRRSFRAAIAWLRHAPGRIMLRAIERARARPRPGAFQHRRPTAQPFRPSHAWKAARSDRAAVHYARAVEAMFDAS